MPKSTSRRPGPARQRYVALLRAINVGGHVVKMDRLRALFESLGFTAVETFIASGNVIFESASADAGELEAKIERHLQRDLGYEVLTFLRTPAELSAVVAHQPFPGLEAAEGALYIGFLKRAPAAEKRQQVIALGTAEDRLSVHHRELYWSCRTRMSDSPVTGARLEKTLAMPSTLRNVTTIRKLAEKYADSR